MALTGKTGLRDYQDPVSSTLNALESGEPLSDDDPKTRNGGLKPNREQDIGQIKMYMSLRQSGQISDKAWARLIERNPASASLFSMVGPNPEILAKRRREEILGQYYSPSGQQPMGPPTAEGQYGVKEISAKNDTENALRALLQAGDMEGAKELMGIASPRSGSAARTVTLKTKIGGKPFTVVLDGTTGQQIAAYPTGEYDVDIQGPLSGTKKYAAEVGKESADISRVADAETSVGDAIRLLDKGIYSGTYAESQKFLAKAIPGVDKTKAANTEEFISHIGNVVIPRLKDFGGSDTVEEMKYLQQVQGGNISLEPKTLRNILISSERKIKARQERMRRQAESVGLGGKINTAIGDKDKPRTDSDRKAREEDALRALRKR